MKGERERGERFVINLNHMAGSLMLAFLTLSVLHLDCYSQLKQLDEIKFH